MESDFSSRRMVLGTRNVYTHIVLVEVNYVNSEDIVHYRVTMWRVESWSICSQFSHLVKRAPWPKFSAYSASRSRIEQWRRSSRKFLSINVNAHEARVLFFHIFNPIYYLSHLLIIKPNHKRAFHSSTSLRSNNSFFKVIKFSFLSQDSFFNWRVTNGCFGY